MMILGIDPSIANFGLALVSLDSDGFVIECAECIVTKPRKGEPGGVGLMRRTAEICDALRHHKYTDADAIAVEAMAFIRGRQRLETAAMSGRARGIVDMLASMRRMPVYEIQPKTAKKALTGNPSASKEAMIAGAVKVTHGSSWILDSKRAHQEHIADAIGMAVAALASQKRMSFTKRAKSA